MKENLDGIGVAGSIFHVAMIVVIIGATILFFIYCWRKNILNFSQEPADDMVEYEDFDLEEEKELEDEENKDG